MNVLFRTKKCRLFLTQDGICLGPYNSRARAFQCRARAFFHLPNSLWAELNEFINRMMALEHFDVNSLAGCANARKWTVLQNQRLGVASFRSSWRNNRSLPTKQSSIKTSLCNSKLIEIIRCNKEASNLVNLGSFPYLDKTAEASFVVLTSSYLTWIKFNVWNTVYIKNCHPCLWLYCLYCSTWYGHLGLTTH